MPVSVKGHIRKGSNVSASKKFSVGGYTRADGTVVKASKMQFNKAHKRKPHNVRGHTRAKRALKSAII